MAEEQLNTVEKTVQEQNIRQYLSFKVQEEMYCVDIACTREIIEYGKLTAVPLMPKFVRGVINLRGRVVPIIDLAVRFGHDTSEITKRSSIIVVEVGEEKQVVGVLVDGVSEVLDIGADLIETAPSFGAKIRVDFIAGMARMKEGFMIVLKVDRVLSVAEMSALTDISKQIQC